MRHATLTLTLIGVTILILAAYNPTITTETENPFKKVEAPHYTGFAHTHTETLVKSADGLSIKSGTLAQVDIVKEAEAGLGDFLSTDKKDHQHKVVSHLPFLNTKKLTEAELLSMGIDAPQSDRILFFKTTEFEIISEKGEKLNIKVAYDLVIK